MTPAEPEVFPEIVVEHFPDTDHPYHIRLGEEAIVKLRTREDVSTFLGGFTEGYNYRQNEGA